MPVHFGAAPNTHSTMSILKDMIARLKGNPEAAAALGADATSIEQLEAEATKAEATLTPVIPPEFESRIKAAEAQANAFRESIALGASRAFASQMIAERRMHKADEADAQASFLDAARIDGGGAVALNDNGELIEGAAVARIRRSYASRPQHQHGTQQIPDGNPAAEGSLTAQMSDQRRTTYLGATTEGKKILQESKN